MTWHTGTATSAKDLLNVLRVNLIAAGWTITEYTAGVVDYLYFSCPGRTTFSFHGSVRTTSDNNWETRGAMGYDSTLPNPARFLNQPNPSPSVFTRLHPSSITYWMAIDATRAIVIAKIGITYRTWHFGVVEAYNTPTQYPVPAYLGSDSNYAGTTGEQNAAIRAFWDPAVGTAYLRDTDGTWRSVANHKPSATLVNNPLSGSLLESASDPSSYMVSYSPDSAISDHIAPWNTGFSDTYNTVQALRSSLLTPAQLLSYPGAVWGNLKGVFHLSGFGRTPEQILTIGPDTYMVFPNIQRTGLAAYAAIKRV